ncbi:hypothetical protein DM02DRAFT_136859 [Periconia macrospinosa]|uniref:F-box domain-containing protein n=1 Tax=Periconia macrospinosa TaxID=97972 RepID=A0A2V1DCM2_9PLEO|nr:hypothetical protein DM02DRAFT_136859 [Periconia macrospinosa]
MMTLSALPSELVTCVTEHLDISSFRSFRLVCSPLQVQSLHCFKRRFFQKQTIEWTLHSLQQFQEISESHFGAALKDLVIDATPRFALKSAQLYDLLSLHEDYESKKALESGWLQVEAEKDRMASFWNETRQDVKILTSVFGRIGALRSITFAYDRAKLSARGLYEFTRNSQREMSRPFVSTLAAVAIANLTVSAIITDPIRKQGAVSVGRLETVSPILIPHEDVFLRLEVLKLTLREFRRPNEGFALPIGKPPFWVRLLSKFKHLRTLDLSFCTIFQENSLRHMAKHCRYSHLEHCRLSAFQLHNAEDLLAFLSHAKDTLQSLSIDRTINMGEPWSWAEAWSRLAVEFPYLNQLELKDLFLNQTDRVNFGERGGSKCTSLTLQGPGLAEELTKCAAHYPMADVEDSQLWFEWS